MPLTFQKETFAAIMPELPELFQRHWEEIAANKDVIKLDPAWDRYLQLERDGALHILTVRDGAVLAGYFFAMVHPHLHYATSLTAWSDIFWVKPEHREGWNGVKFFKAAIKMLRDLGVQKVYMVCKVKHDLEPILSRLGFKFVEKVFTKLLEG